MSLHTNLQGRLRNTHLNKSHGLQPVFETVVNSIHSLEESGNLTTAGEIILKIQRQSQSPLDLNTGFYNKDIEGFIVEDNGIGFNDVNMESFETLDSDHKIDKGCRGVGRLLWLKAFSCIEVNSIFLDSKNNLKKRTISFDAQNGIRLLRETDHLEGNRKTCVHLQGFDKKYREYTPKTIDAIANALLEHCLWYFVRSEGVPTIKIQDTDSNISINLNDLYETISVRQFS